MSLDYTSLREGKKYRIRYQIEGLHRVPREGIAAFLAIRESKFESEQPTLIFSGRPQFGTTDLEVRWIIAMWEVDRAEKCYMDRKVREEKRVF